MYVGVPQGSIQGPLLYTFIPSVCKNYADSEDLYTGVLKIVTTFVKTFSIFFAIWYKHN